MSKLASWKFWSLCVAVSTFTLHSYAQIVAPNPHSSESTSKPSKMKRRARLEASETAGSTRSAVVEPTAQVVESQYLHQTAAQKIEVTPAFTYYSITTNYKNLDTPKSSESTGFATTVMGEYGMHTIYSVGARLNYVSLQTSYTPVSSLTESTSRGLANPDLFINARWPLVKGTLRFGGDLLISLDKNRVEGDNSSNVATGGHSLTPYLGYELPVSKGIAGARLQYDLYKGDRSLLTTNSSGTSTGSTIKGGATLGLSLFYEQPVQFFTLGGAISYYETTKTKTITGSTVTDVDNSHRNYVWQIYGAVPAAPNLTLLPSLSYGVLGSSGQGLSQYVDNTTGFAATIAARILL